jgi:hypothetical protein
MPTLLLVLFYAGLVVLMLCVQAARWLASICQNTHTNLRTACEDGAKSLGACFKNRPVMGPGLQKTGFRSFPVGRVPPRGVSNSA